MTTLKPGNARCLLVPILAALPLYGDAGGIADLDPDRTRSGSIGETGSVERRNVAIEYRSAEGRNDRLRALAAELVRRQVAVSPLSQEKLERGRVAFGLVASFS